MTAVLPIVLPVVAPQVLAAAGGHPSPREPGNIVRMTALDENNQIRVMTALDENGVVRTMTALKD